MTRDGAGGSGSPPTAPAAPDPAGRDREPPKKGRARSVLAGPFGARLIGAVLAIGGVALLIIGLLAIRPGSPSHGTPPPAARGTTGGSSGRPSTTGSATPSPTAADSTSSSAPSAATAGPSATRSGPPPPPSGRPPSRPPRLPLTVLNNTIQRGLAQQAAARFAGAGWPIALVANFSGRIPSTTAYYTPGDAAQAQAANELAAEFAGVHRVMPRYDGLPPTPPGLVVVITPDWTG